jgi:hypothetical protein
MATTLPSSVTDQVADSCPYAFTISLCHRIERLQVAGAMRDLEGTYYTPS